MEAREYIRSLRMTPSMYKQWSKAGQGRPRDIPVNPWIVYREAGWKNLEDYISYPPGEGVAASQLPHDQEDRGHYAGEDHEEEEEVGEETEAEEGEAATPGKKEGSSLIVTLRAGNGSQRGGRAGGQGRGSRGRGRGRGRRGRGRRSPSQALVYQLSPRRLTRGAVATGAAPDPLGFGVPSPPQEKQQEHQVPESAEGSRKRPLGGSPLFYPSSDRKRQRQQNTAEEQQGFAAAGGGLRQEGGPEGKAGGSNRSAETRKRPREDAEDSRGAGRETSGRTPNRRLQQQQQQTVDATVRGGHDPHRCQAWPIAAVELPTTPIQILILNCSF